MHNYKIQARKPCLVHEKYVEVKKPIQKGSNECKNICWRQIIFCHDNIKYVDMTKYFSMSSKILYT